MNRKLIVPLLVAVAGAGVIPGSASAASPARCTTTQLSAHLGTGGAAAGSQYVPVVWTNKSTHACTLNGYPGVSYVAPSNGHQVGAAATRNPQHPANTVTLKPGGHASALVQMTDYQNYPKSRCKATSVSGLRVYPPGSHSAEYVKFKVVRKACSTKVNQLSVMAVVKGKSGQ